MPETCKFCSTTRGSALNHIGGTATCKNKAVCSRCDLEYGNFAAHIGGTATCYQLALCDVCGQSYGTYTDHVGGTATCQHGAQCEVCLNYYGQLADHKWVSATCLQPKQCEVCLATEGSALNHIGGTATCQAKAICDRCANPYGDFASHDWLDATCTLPKTCQVCSATDGQANEHEWDGGMVTTAPGCLTTGILTSHCIHDGCNAVKTDTISALGHGYEERIVSPTCLNAGYVVRYCTRTDCTQSYVVQGSEITATGHKWNRERTCTLDHTCTVPDCGVTEGALGHDYPTVGVSTSPTCLDRGYDTFTCRRGDCGDTYVVYTKAATGHAIAGQPVDHEEATDTDCLYVQYHVCANCKALVAGNAVYHHNYTASITTAATCQTTGVKTYTCSVCQASYNETISVNADAHNWVAGVKVGNVIPYSCANGTCTATKTTIDASEATKTDISAEDLKSAGEVQLKEAAIGFDENTKSQLSTAGDLELSADKLSADSLELDEELREQIGDNPVFNFNVKQGGNSVSAFNGKVTVTVPYTLKQGEDVDSIAIWYINNEGQVESIKATYSAGYVTFETTHFSYYTVAALTPSETCLLYGHTYEDTVVSPTCMAKGYTLRVCTRCGDTSQIDETAQLRHVYGEPVIVSATCVTAGSKTYTCTNPGCTNFYSDVLEATGHHWATDSDARIAPDCLTAGTEKFVCTNPDCNEYYTETIPALGHAYNETSVRVVTPTCVTAGYTRHSCIRCDYYFDDTSVNPLGHSFAIDCGKSVSATCLTTGKNVYGCVRCDAGYEESTPATGHAYDAGTIVSPTCLADGYTNYVCTNPGCSSSYNNAVVAALGHDMVKDVQSSTAATCVASGTDVYVCSRKDCTYSENKTVAPLGHNFIKDEANSVTPTCLVKGKDAYNCSNAKCTVTREVTLEKLPHTYVDTIVAPGCLTTGYTLHECSACGVTYTNLATPATGHTWVGDTCSACGSVCTHPTEEIASLNLTKYGACATTISYRMCSDCHSLIGYTGEITLACHMQVVSVTTQTDASGKLHTVTTEKCSKCGLTMATDKSETEHDSKTCIGTFNVGINLSINTTQIVHLQKTVNETAHRYADITIPASVYDIDCDGVVITAYACSDCYDVVRFIDVSYTCGAMDDAEEVTYYTDNSGKDHKLTTYTCTAHGVVYTLDALLEYADDCAYYQTVTKSIAVDGNTVASVTMPQSAELSADFHHNWVLNTENSTMGDCETTGVQIYECSRCGNVKADFTSGSGHMWVRNTNTIVTPTCAQAGSYEKTCSVCGTTVVDTIDTLAHTWVKNDASVVAATCAQTGSYEKICTVCNATTNVTTAKGGHNYVNGICSVCSAGYDIVAAFASSAVVPTIDGTANEAIWQSAQTIDGVKVLWSDTGFYFAADKNSATFSFVEAQGAQTQQVTVNAGAVTAPAGSTYVVGDVAEIFVPFTYYTEEYDGWFAYGFVQERTQGDHEDVFGAYKTYYNVSYSYVDGNGVTQTGSMIVKQAIKNSSGSLACANYTQANDIVGNTFTFNNKTVTYAGPYGFINMMNGTTGSYTWDDNQVTGESRPERTVVNAAAENITINTNLPFDLQTFEDETLDLDYNNVTLFYNSYDSDGNPIPRYGQIPAQFAYASYVDDMAAPVIDGAIDDVWASTAKMYHLNEIDDPLWNAYGYVSVLWGNEGLYFLGYVKDTALSYAGTGFDDRIMFNVTETYGGQYAPTHNPESADQMGTYGPYAFAIDPAGQLNNASNPVVQADGTQFAAQIWEDENGYTVEAYIPYFTLDAQTAEIGHIMGLESSVDDYRDPCGVQNRDEYTNLGNLSGYWSNPQSQFKVVFVGSMCDGAYDGTTTPVAPTFVLEEDTTVYEYGDVFSYEMTDGTIVDLWMEEKVDFANPTQSYRLVETNLSNNRGKLEKTWCYYYEMDNGAWYLAQEQIFYHATAPCGQDASRTITYITHGKYVDYDAAGAVINTTAIERIYNANAHCSGVTRLTKSDGTITEVTISNHIWSAEVRIPIDGNCENGFNCVKTCRDCGLESSYVWYFGHDLYEVADAEYTFETECGTVGMVNTCCRNCDYQQAFFNSQCECEYEYTDDVAVCTCSICGFTYSIVSEFVPVDGCVGYNRDTYCFDGKEPYVIENTDWMFEQHTFVQTIELVDEALGCTGGVHVARACSVCGAISYEETVNWHYPQTSVEYDLTAYGSGCGQRIEDSTCVCGQERYIGIRGDGCDFENSFDQETGKNVYTCRICEYFYTMGFEWVDEGNCIGHSVETYNFTANTGNDPFIIAIVGQSEINHECTRCEDLPNEAREYVLDNGNTVRVTAYQNVCEECSAITIKTVLEKEYNENEILVKETTTFYSYSNDTFLMTQINETTYGIIASGKSFKTCEEMQGYNNGQPSWQETFEYDYPEFETGNYCHVIYYRIDNETGDRIQLDERTEHNYQWTCELADGSESCLDGVNYMCKCFNCGDVSSFELRTDGHYTNSPCVEYDLTAYGTKCGQIILEKMCLCGEQHDIALGNDGCNFENCYDEETGKNVYTCRICGYFYTMGFEWVDEGNCAGHNFQTYNFGTNTDNEPLTFSFNGQSEVCHNYQWVGELAEGSKKCTDGVNYMNKCQGCGDVICSELRTDGHYNATRVEYDLTFYGSGCGQIITEYKCLCGENHYISWRGEGCDFESSYNEEIGGSVFTCRACEYSYTRVNEWIDEGNCTGHSVETYNFTVNTGNDPFIIAIVGQSETNHECTRREDLPNEAREYVAENGNTVRVTAYKEICEACSAITQKTVHEQEYNANDILVKETYTYYSYTNETFVINQITVVEYGIIANGKSFVTRRNSLWYENGQPTWQNTYEYEYPDSAIGNYCHYKRYQIDSKTSERIFLEERNEHDFNWTYELIEGSTSCLDGVNHIRKCRICGYIDETETQYDGHVYIGGKLYDLTAYKSQCGQRIQDQICLCGEEHFIAVYGDGCDFDRMYECYDDLDVNTFTCRVCGYSYSVETEWVDDGNCTGHNATTYHFGTNTDNESLTFTIVGQSQANHKSTRYEAIPNEAREYTAENGNTVAVAVQQEICNTCKNVTRKIVSEIEYYTDTDIPAKKMTTDYSCVSGVYVISSIYEMQYGILADNISYETLNRQQYFKNGVKTQDSTFVYDYWYAASGNYCYYTKYALDTTTGERTQGVDGTNHLSQSVDVPEESSERTADNGNRVTVTVRQNVCTKCQMVTGKEETENEYSSVNNSRVKETRTTYTCPKEGQYIISAKYEYGYDTIVNGERRQSSLEEWSYTNGTEYSHNTYVYEYPDVATGNYCHYVKYLVQGETQIKVDEGLNNHHNMRQDLTSNDSYDTTGNKIVVSTFQWVCQYCGTIPEKHTLTEYCSGTDMIVSATDYCYHYDGTGYDLISVETFYYEIGVDGQSHKTSSVCQGYSYGVKTWKYNYVYVYTNAEIGDYTKYRKYQLNPISGEYDGFTESVV